MSINNIEVSEERQVNLQLEYINYTTEDILEKKVASVKRRRSVPASTSEAENEAHHIQEQDNTSIQGLNESVGSYIKNIALSSYKKFSDFSVTKQTAISLGMNSILDLSYAFGDGHSTIFTQKQWDELQEKFKAEVDEDAELETSLNPLVGQYLQELDNLNKQKSSVNKKTKSLSIWIKSASGSSDLNEDKECFLFAVDHIITLRRGMPHFFNSAIDTSEWDYVVGVWSPLLTKVFIGNPGLRIKWGDTIFTLASEDGQSDLKIDIRVILDRITQRFNVEHDVSSGEFSKYDPGQLKYQSDRSKVLIEGKNIINNMVSLGLEPCPVPVLQICGTELYFLEIYLIAPGLYVGNEIAYYPITNTWDNFKTLPSLVKSLIKYKNQCAIISDLLSEQLTTIENKKGSTSGSKYKRSSLPSINTKRNWTRNNWIVFRDQKYDQHNIPHSPF